MSDPCLFCQIARGELDSHRIYEDEYTLAFLDINPAVEGHTVIIPKNHYRKLEDIPEVEIGKLFTTVQLVTQKVQKAMDTDSSNVGINNGPPAGQAIPHAHIHVFPRREDDGGGSLHSIINSSPKRDLKEVQEIIRKEFESG